ncbi:transglutaminase domain-containing protein [Stenotrophomonas rhizophila]|uniref:transglutaminase domain-containing protein n=1 Tax=Stenotrophomonas rhizophila TaxID=216778 RepID=UPI001E4BE3E1|nr:transglutaminase domain-containing protein [Stenotrophomonas rhizophila]MCC7632768.1 tetratricopeptide repeat protein [Stenotrophomonas rhizophila]MCC7662507.1 tetratricopeptide repeat protein [Stenotrophomonas rhizophila]
MSAWKALALLAGLAASAPVPAATAQPTAAAPETTATLPTAEQILAVPPALQALLQQRVIAPGASREQRLQRLLQLIFDEQGMHLEYDPYATNTLTETWQTGRANCLSFTLLFVTLARAAGIDARVQEVAQVVSWHQDQGVIYSVGHVNAGIVLNGRDAVVDLDRNVLYDRYGPRPIPAQRALAHFYNNRGAASMAAGDTGQARAYLQQALALAPDLVAGWSNLGVLETRLGNLAQARQDYLTALQLHPRHAASLTNASALFRRLGDTAQAAQLARRLEQVQRSDPFVQFQLGNQAEQRHDYARAIHYYQRAVRLYDSAHQFHFGLARAYFLAGENRRASLEMTRARDLAGDNADVLKARYQAKLGSLQRWRQRSAAAN